MILIVTDEQKRTCQRQVTSAIYGLEFETESAGKLNRPLLLDSTLDLIQFITSPIQSVQSIGH